MKAPKTVLVGAPEPEMDPHLLMLDGRDIRSVNRHTRRSAGFRGPAFQNSSPSLQRYVRKHAREAGFEAIRAPRTDAGRLTRRASKQRARIKRLVAKRGLS